MGNKMKSTIFSILLLILLIIFLNLNKEKYVPYGGWRWNDSPPPKKKDEPEEKKEKKEKKPTPPKSKPEKVFANDWDQRFSAYGIPKQPLVKKKEKKEEKPIVCQKGMPFCSHTKKNSMYFNSSWAEPGSDDVPIKAAPVKK